MGFPLHQITVVTCIPIVHFPISIQRTLVVLSFFVSKTKQLYHKVKQGPHLMFCKICLLSSYKCSMVMTILWYKTSYFLTSNYTKRWTNYWRCKTRFWLLVSQCRNIIVALNSSQRFSIINSLFPAIIARLRIRFLPQATRGAWVSICSCTAIGTPRPCSEKISIIFSESTETAELLRLLECTDVILRHARLSLLTLLERLIAFFHIKLYCSS